MNGLHELATRMVSPGRGILAADESITTMSTRLENVGVPASADTRRAYRELLLTTPDLATWVSGIILSDETFGQCLTDGRQFPTAAVDLGILTGIKVDTGARPLALVPGGTVTEGLDGLRERLAGYGRLGAAFAKWRGVLSVGGPGGSDAAVRANAHALARYAALCQEADIVPIVEPEVLMTGDHGIEACADQTTRTLTAVFDELVAAHVDLRGIVLKPNMVVPGTQCARRSSPEEVARATLGVLDACVPPEVPGIAFLSGGQDNATATASLSALNASGTRPWRLTFSFGRALVNETLECWRGRAEHAGMAQLALRNSCRRAAEASGYATLPR